MKNSISYLFLGLIALSVTSCCTIRGGGVSGYDTYKSSYSAKSSSVKNSAASQSLASNKSTSSEFGFFVGLSFTDIELTDKFEFQPEVNFLAIKDLNQLQAPLLAKYEVVDKLSLLAGPSLGFLLDAPDGIKSFNLGAEFGASYDITEKFLITTRYDLGLSNLLENGGSNNSVKFSNFQIGIGYRL